MQVKNKNPVQTRFDFWDVSVVDKKNYQLKSIKNKLLIIKKSKK